MTSGVMNKDMKALCKHRRLMYEQIEEKLQAMATEARSLKQYYEGRSEELFGLDFHEPESDTYKQQFAHIDAFMNRLVGYEKEFEISLKAKLEDIEQLKN